MTYQPLLTLVGIGLVAGVIAAPIDDDGELKVKPDVKPVPVTPEMPEPSRPIVKKNPVISNAITAHEITFKQYERIELRAKIDAPEGSKVEYYWEIDGVETSLHEEDSVLSIWAMPGTYEASFECIVVTKEGGPVKKIRDKFILIVLGARPPPVKPTEPTEPDRPVKPTEPVEPTEPEFTVDKAVVVYESATDPISPHAMAARNGIEDAGIEYRIVDKDVTTGTGSTPKDVAPAIKAARDGSTSLPVLVMLDGEKVVEVVKLPDSISGIIEAVTNNAN